MTVPFAFLGAGHRAPEVLRHLLTRTSWKPQLIVDVTESPGAPAAERDGIPRIAVSSVQGAELWRAMAQQGIRGVLAVGVREPEDAFLDAFPSGVYGLHPSLLPALAGPAALNWSLIRGLSQTGATLFRYARDGDGWLLVSQRACSIDERETAASLGAKLAAASADVWAEQWPAIARGDVPTRAAGALQRNLRRRPADGRIRWEEHSAGSLERWIRALSRPYPGAYFWFGGRRVWVHGVERDGGGRAAGDAPTLASVSADGVVVEYPDGRLRLSALRGDQDGDVPRHLLDELALHAGARLSSLHAGKRVLVLAAHPDDDVLGIGGTLIRHFEDGAEIRVVIVCSADSIRYREGEQDQAGDAQRAAFYLGARSVGLGFPDQRLDRGSNLELIQALEQQLREFQPQLVYTHWWGDVNADHVRIAEAVDVAVRPYPAPGIEALYAFETPSSSEWTASNRAGAFAPNGFVDISRVLERKLDAMSCYASELRPHPHPRSLQALRERAAYWGSVANMPAAEPLLLLRARHRA